MPAAVGVPDNCPEFGSSVTPDGRVPLDTVYANGSTPPAATTLRTNADPAVPVSPEVGAV